MKIKNILLSLLLIIVCLMVSVLGSFILFYFYPKNIKKVTNLTKTEKEVTITDNGISESVKKIYDATVVVITSNNNKAVGSGSGFVYKKDKDVAYIITNDHVVNIGDSYNIKLANDEILKAKLIGGDPYADIAVLSVDAAKIDHVAVIGDASKMNVGDTVFAVGAPLNYQAFSFSVTRGILSGKDRAVEVSLNSNYNTDWVMKVLQTDTAINSGDSGGPLCNVNGEVIGVTNLKLAKTGIEGMGFAIAIGDAIESADNIIAGHQKEYPSIGVSLYNVSDLYIGNVTGYDTNLTSGVIIAKINDGGSVSKSDLKVGDIITKINDQKITNIANFRYYLYQYKIGDTVKLTINRDGEEKVIDLKLIK